MMTGMEDARFGVAHLDRIALHYAEMGPEDGPLVILLHGFPDNCLGWRHQMPDLAKAGFRVIAPDQRGYGVSGKPKGVAAYDLDELAEDVIQLGKHFGEEKLRVVGHDWGGAVAWAFALNHPEMTEKLIVLNLPHPRGLARELANDPDQQRASIYAQNFKREGAHLRIGPAVAHRELMGLVIEEPVAARLRLQTEGEGRIRVDVDVLDGIHLDGDGKAHVLLLVLTAPRGTAADHFPVCFRAKMGGEAGLCERKIASLAACLS